MDLSRIDNCWIAIEVVKNWEASTAKSLGERGYETAAPTMPVCSKCSQHCDGHALFGGYIFCRFRIEGKLPILGTPGVKRIVSFGLSIPIVPDREIRDALVVGTTGRCIRPVSRPNAGQKLIIATGPLQGVSGSYVETGKNGRIIISITLLQRHLSIDLEPGDIEQAGRWASDH